MTEFIDPDRMPFVVFKDLDRDALIEMPNLVMFRAEARYPPHHALATANLTGAQTYRNYGSETAPILARIGVSILWRGTFQTTLIGPQNEAWDEVFIVRYPTAHTVLEMVTDPAYRTTVIHRQAAVEPSRLICNATTHGGDSFE